MTSLFPKRWSSRLVTKQSRDSTNDTTESISDAGTMIPSPIMEHTVIEEEEEEYPSEEVRQIKEESLRRDQALSNLLTGTSTRNIQQFSSSLSEPTKSILKSTSTIKTSSGGNQYFTASNYSRESRLSFSSISVRVYPVLIGDNPSVTQGVPLTIGWEHKEEEFFDNVEDYESSTHKSKPVASLQEMKFTELERAQIAKNLGYSDSKIHKIAHQVKFSTLTRKKKIIRTLHLDTMKSSVRRGLGKISDSSRNIFGAKQEEEEDSDDDGRDMAF